MKNILSKIEQKLNVNPSDEMRINQMMCALFTDRNTIQSIEIFEQLKVKFEAEIRTRNVNALIENSEIEAYFNPKRKVEVL